GFRETFISLADCISSSWVSNPDEDITSVNGKFLLALILKLPFASVMVASVVPLMVTVTPTRLSLDSLFVIFPVIETGCANRLELIMITSISRLNLYFINRCFRKIPTLFKVFGNPSRFQGDS